MSGSGQMNIQEAVLAVVREHCAIQRWAYTPDMIINGRPGFAGEEAEELIYAAAAKIGLTQEEAERSFPYGTYFEPQISLSFWPFLLVQRLFRRPTTYQPLTARGFAELLAKLRQEAHPA